MKNVKGFKCVGCGSEHRKVAGRMQYACPSCGGNLQVVYDYKKIKRSLGGRLGLEKNRDLSVWRYAPLLPLAGTRFAPPVHIGWTPLYRSRCLGRELGLKELYIKDDGRNPSASFKDRAGAVVVAHALERGEKLVCGASTGNAASSLACLSSAMGLKTVIFVPLTAPQAKIAQLLVFGSCVVMVRGTYDQAFDLCLKATEQYGWYNRNTGFNPFTREGKKTCAFELVEQLGWKCPDIVFVPVGDGNIISGVWKGFMDFKVLGLIDRLPRLVAVQSGESDAVKRAFEADGVIRAVSGNTLADSISVSLPRDGAAAVQALRESGGFAVGVTDGEVLEAMKKLARTEGVFAEPAAAAAVAGLQKAVAGGKVGPRERAVVLVTGNGLKDVAGAMRAVNEPWVIDPDVADLKKLVEEERWQA